MLQISFPPGSTSSGGGSGASLSDATPAPLAATASSGSAADASRSDHQHVFPTPAQIGAATAAQGALAATAVQASLVGTPSGVASLDSAAKLPHAQLPTLVATDIPDLSVIYQPLASILTSVSGLSKTVSGLVKLINGVASLDTSTYLTGNQVISLSGDAAGSGATAIALTLASTGVTAGAYGSATAVPVITIDAKGRATGASTATITPAGIGAIATTALGAASGVATLGSDGRLTPAQTPSALVGAVVYQGTWNASTNTPTLASGAGTKGYYYVVSTAGTTAIDGVSSWNTGDWIIYNGTAWNKLDGISSEVVSVAGRTGAVVLAATDVGLGNVTNVAQLPYAQTLTVTGDATASATALSAGTIALTLAASGATAGTYNSGATAVTPFTIDAKGRVTGTGAAVTITPAWGSVTGKPTTIAGYGITDALTLGTTTPVMNGTAAVGGVGKAADAGHVHPTDTTRAAAGANSDITSLSGLTTAVSVAQGGTGATTAAAALAALGGLSSYLPSAQLFIGSASNAATAVTLSGDAQISNAGALTINKINGKNISLAGSFYTNGANTVTLTSTAYTTVTLPTSGTLLSTASPVTVAQGGTGSTTAAAALTALGAAASGTNADLISTTALSSILGNTVFIGTNTIRVNSTASCDRNIIITGGVSGSGTFATIGTNTNLLEFTTGIMIDGAFYPKTDNTINLGSSTNRFSVLYAGTSTISTSDGTQKTLRDGTGAFTDAEKAVAAKLKTMAVVYQLNDSIAEKGADKARLHTGFIAQDVAKVFTDAGLDPTRYGLYCADEIEEEYDDTETVEVPKTEPVTVEVITVTDGKAVLTTTTEDRAVYQDLPVVDASGTPVLGPDGTPRTTRCPVTETITRTVKKTRGTGTYRLGLRYDELSCFIMAAT